MAAAAIGLAGAIGARRVQVTPLVIAMAGIMPLVLGMALYRGFVDLVNGQPTTGIGSVVVAAGTALALGVGVVLGPLLAPSIRHGLARYHCRRRGGSRRFIVSHHHMLHLAGIRPPPVNYPQ